MDEGRRAGKAGGGLNDKTFPPCMSQAEARGMPSAFRPLKETAWEVGLGMKRQPAPQPRSLPLPLSHTQILCSRVHLLSHSLHGPRAWVCWGGCPSAAVRHPDSLSEASHCSQFGEVASSIFCHLISCNCVHVPI